MEFFDRYTLTNEQLQQLSQIVHSPHFVPESVREVSKACESLCRWVQAVFECCCLQNQLLLGKHLEALAKKAQDKLDLATQHKEEAYRHLEDVKLQLQLVQKELEEQFLELNTVESTGRVATTAAEQLVTHVREWRIAAQVKQSTFHTVYTLVLFHYIRFCLN